MENQNSTSANVIEKNVSVSVPASKEKKVKKSVKKESTDSINIDKIKVDLSKGKKNLLTKESTSVAKKSLYKGTDSLGEIEAKKFRGKIRRQLHRFVSDILGKDRSNDEREKSVKAFLKFYKENWKVQDFKIENFTNTNNPIDKKDYQELLSYVQSVLK